MEWLIYLLKASACLCLFYAFYHFFLQGLTFFSANRVYLLATLMISFVIPAMQLEIERSVVNQAQPIEAAFVPDPNHAYVQNAGAEVGPSPQVEVNESFFSGWEQLLVASYWLGAILMSGALAFQVFQLLRHTRHVSHKIGRLKVVMKAKGFTNCSFLNYIFVDSENLSEKEMAVILQHEQVHVARYHSADKLLISASKVLLWFNPVVYLYGRALEQIHEYEADKETSLEIGSATYADVLLGIAVRNNNSSLVDSFVKNPLTRRIKMLFTNQSNNMKKLAYLVVLPLVMALTWVFAVQLVYANEPAEVHRRIETKSVQIEKVPKLTEPDKKIGYKKTTVRNNPSDTLWMIDYPSLGKYTEVTINGKSYGPEILTKISPHGIKTVRGTAEGKLEITTWHEDIRYATEIDKGNIKIRNKARASGKAYLRYRQKHQDGSRYEVISVRSENGSGGSVSLDKGKKALLIFEGEQYSERQLRNLKPEELNGYDMRFSGVETNEEIKAKYGKGYGSMVEISKSGYFLGEEERAFRDLNSADADSKLSYLVRDSIWLSDDKKSSKLFGGVKITQGELKISADKAKYEDAGEIIYAKNVSFTSELHRDPVTALFMKFNLKEGTYQILQHISDL